MTTKGELLKVIRLQCEECMGSEKARKREFSETARNLVTGCTAPECSLFPFRLGSDPWKKRKGNPDNLRKALHANSVRNRTA